MRKVIMILVMTMAALTAFATPKVIRESKWNAEMDYKYTLMYDDENTYGGSYYIMRTSSEYTDGYERIIGADLMEYWLARENNNGGKFDLTDEKISFSQEENTFISYVRVTRR